MIKLLYEMKMKFQTNLVHACTAARMQIRASQGPSPTREKWSDHVSLSAEGTKGRS